jgi:hypothetical protein
MRRSLSLLFFAASVATITACSNIAGPNRDGEEEDDSTAFCSVVGGTQTRCEDPR